MNCDCFPVRWPQSLGPGGSDQFAVDFGLRLARLLTRRTSYDLGMRLRSRQVAGFEWEVTRAGQTGSLDPRLPVVVGDSVVDGSCVLTCREISAASLESQISVVTWQAPSGITATDVTWDVTQRVAAVLSVGPTVQPGEYEVVVTANAGQKVIPQTCVLRVGSC